MAKRQKVPKNIAGVKVPKPLRRGLRDLAASQNGRRALTEALASACSALCAAQQPAAQGTPQTAKGGKAPAGDDGQASKETARATAAAALEDAARAFTEALKSRGAKEPSPPSTVTH